VSRPIISIVLPADLVGQTNGAIDPALLEEIAPGVALHTRAARSWRAMAADCQRATNHELRASYGYRPLSTQMSYFLERHVLVPTGGAVVTCMGRTWFRLPGRSSAACPGRSNHGLGLAVDLDTQSQTWCLRWLEEHAVAYGWSWEAGIDIEEPWHLHYWAGDAMFHVEHSQEDDMGLTPTYRYPTQRPVKPGEQPVLDFAYAELDTQGQSVFGYVIDSKIILRRPGGGEVVVFFDGAPQVVNLSPDGRPAMLAVPRPGLCSIVGAGVEAFSREIWRAG